MKTGVFYTTKSGASEVYALRIADYIDDCEMINIDKDKVRLEDYDRIILGSGIRVGRVYRSMKSFLKKNQDTLLTKDFWMYFASIDKEGFSNTIEKNISNDTRMSAKSIVSLQGKSPFTRTDTELSSWLDETALKAFIGDILS